MSTDERAGDPYDSGVFAAQNKCYLYARAEAISLFGEGDIPMVYVEQSTRPVRV